MTMTVSDFLELPITKEFKVISGKANLNKAMQNVEILDFELMDGFEQTRETMFTKNSLVLTSLLFANNQPELLMKMIEKLSELEVSALAFKPIIYKELPREVILLAEEKSLPLLQFGGDEFFEDIILQAMDYRNKTAQTQFLETTLAYLIENEVNTEQLTPLLKQLNKPFETYTYILAIQSDVGIDENLFRYEPFFRNGLIGSYKNSVLIIMTNKEETYEFENRMEELLRLFEWNVSKFYKGKSNIHSTYNHFATALKEAYYSSVFAKIMNKEEYIYNQLTTEKLLIEMLKNRQEYVENYIETYIRPLEDTEGLVETAISYVLNEGNIKEVAKEQFCHQNTVRYRINKIKNRTHKNASEFVFFEHLSVAIKLYLIQKELSL